MARRSFASRPRAVKKNSAFGAVAMLRTMRYLHRLRGPGLPSGGGIPLGDGVMVTLRFLVPSFKVRVLVPQPLPQAHPVAASATTPILHMDQPVGFCAPGSLRLAHGFPDRSPHGRASCGRPSRRPDGLAPRHPEVSLVPRRVCARRPVHRGKSATYTDDQPRALGAARSRSLGGAHWRRSVRRSQAGHSALYDARCKGVPGRWRSPTRSVVTSGGKAWADVQHRRGLPGEDLA